MCPYCADEHIADSCDFHGKMKTNCTACARHAQRQDPNVDLKQMFLESHRHMRHSPLDPTCPARLAGKKALVAPAKQASAPTPQPPPVDVGMASSTAAPIVIPDERPPTPVDDECKGLSSEDDEML